MNAAAFDSLVLAHRPALTRAAFALTRDASEAQDLVQETLLRAFTRFSQLSEPGAAGSWLRKILRSVFLNRREAALSRARIEERRSRDTSPIAPDTADAAIARVEARALLAALERLPGEARELVWLAHVEELDYREIARRTHLAPPVIKSRLYRARQQVRAALAA